MKVRALATIQLGFDEVFVIGKEYEVTRAFMPVNGEVRRVLRAVNEVGKSHVIADNWLGYGDTYFERYFDFIV